MNDNELLDQNEKIASNYWERLINLILICSAVLVPLITVLKVWFEMKLMVSPFAPSYTAIYLNSAIINISCFLFAALLPGLYLRIKKHYIMSSICIFVFFTVGFIFRHYFSFYENFI